MKKDRKPLQATTFRSILITGVVIAFVIAGAGFYLGYGWLKSYAAEVNTVVKQAGTSGLSLGSLDGLQENLDEQQDLVAKVTAMFASSTDFQSTAIREIQMYASNNRISIEDISLNTTDSTDPASAPAPSTLTVTFASPPSYSDLLKFIAGIQKNTPKMQVSGVNITRLAEPDDDKITIESMDIVVATR